MKVRILAFFAICSLAAASLIAADVDLSGKWITDEGAKVLAERQQRGRGGQSTQAKNNNPPPAFTMELSLDGKKTKVSGKITEVITSTTYEILEGKADGKKFSFKIKPTPTATSVPWNGELTDENTVTLTRDTAGGATAIDPMVFHRTP